MRGPIRWARDQWWTAERFGLTPAKLARRAAHRDGPRVLCITIPKSGTHLLERVLCLHPRLHRPLVPTLHEGNLADHGGLGVLLPRLKPGGVLFAHLPHVGRFEEAVRANGIRTLLLVRDPRDIAVSEMHYFMARPDLEPHRLLSEQPDDEARVELLLHGRDEWMDSLAARLDRFAGWLDTGAHLVRFEDLVGPEGGGDRERQHTALRSVYAHLGMDLNAAAVPRLCDRVFSDVSPTFRRGRVGGWRTDLTGAQHDVFLREAGSLLRTFGYPADPDRSRS